MKNTADTYENQKEYFRWNIISCTSFLLENDGILKIPYKFLEKSAHENKTQLGEELPSWRNDDHFGMKRSLIFLDLKDWAFDLMCMTFRLDSQCAICRLRFGKAAIWSRIWYSQSKHNHHHRLIWCCHISIRYGVLDPSLAFYNFIYYQWISSRIWLAGCNQTHTTGNLIIRKQILENLLIKIALFRNDC